MSLTLATYITILRILSAPLFVFLLFDGSLGWAIVVFGVACLTDTFDGLVARKFGQMSAFGTVLDPVADKVLLTTAFVSLSIPFLHLASPIPLWLTLTAIARDVMIAIGAWIIRTLRGLRSFPPSLCGKVSTTFQMITVCVALLADYQGQRWVIFDPLIYATLLLTIVSGLDYLRRGLAIMKNSGLKAENI
jgi:cardiolipin synthase (CMP-forming)